MEDGADPVLEDMFHSSASRNLDNVVLNLNFYYVGMMIDALDWLVC